MLSRCCSLLTEPLGATMMFRSHRSLATLVVVLFLASSADAWSFPRRQIPQQRVHSLLSSCGRRRLPLGHPREGRVSKVTGLCQSTDNKDSIADEIAMEFTTEEQARIDEIFAQCAGVGEPDLERIVLETVTTLRPSLVVKLRELGSSDSGATPSAARVVAGHVNRVLESRLVLAKQTLKELLDAGEIRKLDAVIGNAARSGRLDVAFFNVLNINLRDAMMEENSSTTPDETNAAVVSNNDSSAEPKQPSQNLPAGPAATRTQILRHIYTRCQEEMEKTLPPGTALLTKLLRTEQPSIRANLYNHYLTPSASSITSPDGKVINLTSGNTVLVSLTDFIGAIDAAVLQIRTLENANGTDRESAAIMVENCRQVAKEARSIVGQSYGQESDEVRQLEEGLQHVFRPSSASSPYIKGQDV